MPVRSVPRATLGWITLLVLAAAPIDAKPRKVESLSAVVETAYGSMFVSHCMLINPSALRPIIAANAYHSVWSSQPEKYRHETHLKFDSPPAGAWLAVSVYLRAGDEIRAELTPKEWRSKVGTEFLEASMAETVLVMPDGREVPAAFGPDGDLVYFYWDLGTVRTNEECEIVERNYIWQEKDDYLVRIPFHFPMDGREWKSAQRATLRIGEYALEFVASAKEKSSRLLAQNERGGGASFLVELVHRSTRVGADLESMSETSSTWRRDEAATPVTGGRSRASLLHVSERVNFDATKLDPEEIRGLEEDAVLPASSPPPCPRESAVAVECYPEAATRIEDHGLRHRLG